MQKIKIHTVKSYNLKWDIKDAPDYKVSDKGVLINIKKMIVIKKTRSGGSEGAYINGKFINGKGINKLLILIPDEK